MSRGNDYITEIRVINKQIWDGINSLVAKQREWNALDYGTTLEDGGGNNDGLTKIEVGAVVFASADAFTTALDGGIASNMAKLL